MLLAHAFMASFVAGNSLSRTQSISGTGMPRIGEADAISSSKYKNLKLRKKERRNGGLRTGLYSPLRVTCRLRASVSFNSNSPWLPARDPSVRAVTDCYLTYGP